ncbi:uncharacterized protein LOC121458656 [Microtus oregoni]|uniref:uncharacterized protein LOC121458656 n=1 Tax=Microtus oregoni TaxID=111838 RepID=UPI001BB16DC9|nr:uncharacterized protein LOC121458656 [Microtus oregoni]
MAGGGGGGISRTRRARCLRTPHPRQTGVSEALPDCTLLGLAQLHCPLTARRRGRERREPAARSPSPPPLSGSSDGKPRGSRPAHVGERDWTESLEGPTPCWKGWVAGARCPAPGPGPALGGFPGPDCALGTRAENPISVLQSLLKHLPAGLCGTLAAVQRDGGGSAHARAQPCGRDYLPRKTQHINQEKCPQTHPHANLVAAIPQRRVLPPR